MGFLLCGSNSWWFCDTLSSVTGYEKVAVVGKKFPDGEIYVRIPVELKGEKTIVAQSMPYNQAEAIWELMLILDAAVNMRASRITVYAPYIAYSRQDRVFLPGEPISIKVLLQTLSLAGASRLVTVDIHKEHSLAYFRGPAVNVIPAKTLCTKLKEILDEAVVIAPDKGAVGRASLLAETCRWKYDFLEKSRDRFSGEITMKPKAMSVKGKNVVIVDDIIASGGTVARAAEILYSNGAEKVIVAASHALMISEACEKLRKSGVEKIIATNTLPPKKGVDYIDISGEAAEHLV